MASRAQDRECRRLVCKRRKLVGDGSNRKRRAMLPSDRKRFVVCLTAAAELYGKPPSEAVIAMWWGALSIYEIDGVERAFQAHLADPDRGQFMPKPADIVRLLKGTSKDSSLVAWSSVDKAVRG